jgi:hypothetical protein
MAWSPPAHNAGIVWVSVPGDYATFNSNHTPDGTQTIHEGEQPAATPPNRERHQEPNLSEDEHKEIFQFRERKRNRRRAPNLQVISKPGKPLSIDFGSLVERARFMSAFGTSEPAHAELRLYGIVSAACDGSWENPPSERVINEVLAAVAGIGAKDEIEGMLATQMVATHTAIITTLRRQKESETLLGRERYGNLAVKLLRTFAAQVEALQRYRGKGQQHIRVEHVDVHAGGQAIVGAVTTGEGGKEKSDEQLLAPSEITHKPSAPMWSHDPAREAVPVLGGARKAPM